MELRTYSAPTPHPVRSTQIVDAAMANWLFPHLRTSRACTWAQACMRVARTREAFR